MSSPIAAAKIKAPKVTIVGKAVVGTRLRAKTGTWKPAGTKLSYQWLANGKRIAGATRSTYTPSAKLVGKKISVKITGRKSGARSVTRTSGRTAAVKRGVLTPSTPTTTGRAVVGQTLTLTAKPWKPAGTRLAYQWLRNGKKISGATKATYTLQPADVGASVRATVSGSKSGFTTASRSSAPTSKIARGTLAAPTPEILGEPVVGEVLFLSVGAWKPANTALAYRWTRDGAVIAGATTDTYTIGAADAGHRIRAIVTGTKSGYTTASRTSAPTASVVSFYDDAFGTFAPTTYTGYGDDVLDLGAARRGILVTAEHDGASNFVVLARTSEFEWNSLLVNEIGRYTGTTATGLSDYDDDTRMLEIDADGAWSVTVAPISAAPELPQSGSGDGVYLYRDSANTKTLRHDGSSNFIVKQHYRDSRFGERLTWETHVNEIGPYTGTRYFRSGPSVITIEADGAWEVR